MAQNSTTTVAIRREVKERIEQDKKEEWMPWSVFLERELLGEDLR